MSLVKKVLEIVGVGVIATTLLYDIGNLPYINFKYREADSIKDPTWGLTQGQRMYDINHDGTPDVTVVTNVAAGGVLGTGIIITSFERKPTENEVNLYLKLSKSNLQPEKQ